MTQETKAMIRRIETQLEVRHLLPDWMVRELEALLVEERENLRLGL